MINSAARATRCSHVSQRWKVMGKYILALDQGTTSSRAMIFDCEGEVIAAAHVDLKQIFPRPGEVEQDPEEIWASQIKAAKNALARSCLKGSDIACIGVTNQRETTIIWDKRTGKALYNAIVWQCRRTTPICLKIIKEGWSHLIKDKTGLMVDPYFSGTKIKWILDNVKGVRKKAKIGEALFGNVDSWLIWRLTGGRTHATDYTNASRTMLFDIKKLKWDSEILELLKIPDIVLPTVKASSEEYGDTTTNLFGHRIPITGDAGDQQAALFGQCCFKPGMNKNTYGTGSFMLMNTGKTPVISKKGLLTTIAVGIDRSVDYALEGSVFIAGAAVQWLRDQMEFIANFEESEKCAQMVKDSGGVYVVPAFTGLGAPYWDPKARGLIIGITRGTSKNHIIRATLESIAFQVKDVLECMEEDSKINLIDIRADGGAASNDFLMQFQANISGIPVVRPFIRETTALGAAYLAGLAVDYWKNREELVEKWKVEKIFEPNMRTGDRENLIRGWKKAVIRSQHWAT